MFSINLFADDVSTTSVTEIDFSFFDNFLTNLTTFIRDFFINLYQALIDFVTQVVVDVWEFLKYVFDFRNGLFFDIFAGVINQFKGYIDFELYSKYYANVNYFLPISETITMSFMFVTFAITFKLIKALISLIKLGVA